METVCVLNDAWEYHVVAYRSSVNGDLEQFLNENGRHRWELVQLVPVPAGFRCVFKRRK